MANTVTLLSYANTFGDWVVTTNKLAQENNDLAANNYVKPTGTLFLNAPTLGLQVANNAVIQGQLQVSGVGSSAYIQKNLQVDGSIITTGNNYILANDNNAGLNITQVGAGLALRINSQLGGAGTFGANSTVIDANGNVYIGSASAGTFKLNVANGNVNFAQNLTVGSNVTTQIVRVTNHVVSKDVTASANILGDRIQANTNIITPTLAVSGTAYVYYVQANNTVNTETLTVTSSAIVDNLRGNTYVWSPTVVGSSNIISSIVVANTSISTPVLSANTRIDSNTAQLYIDSVFANTVSVQGNFVINGTTVYNSDTLTINSDAAVPQNGFFVSARGTGNANATIRWNEAQDYWDIRDVNNPSSYSKILTANLISDSLTSNSTDTFASSRAANNLNTLILSAYAVANSAGSSGNVLALQVQMTTANANIASLNTFAAAAFGKANAEGTINTTQNTWITNTNTLANAAFGKANSEGEINNTQNTNIASVNTFAFMASFTANGAWATANVSAANTVAINTLATAAYGKANAEGTINSTQNTWITNTDTLASAAYGKANAEGTINSTQNTWITNTDTLARAAFNQANNSSITIINDTTTDATRYPYFGSAISGAISSLNSSSTKLTYNPLSGTLSAVIFTATSDINKKDNVVTITDAVNTVQQLRGVTYNWKDNGTKGMGLIAQEVEEILPELVVNTENGKSISYNNIIGLLVEAIKELKVEIDNLKGDSK